MTDEDYLSAQDTLIMAAKLLAFHDWAAFARRISDAETVGVFFMAPMLYQKATARTDHIGEMAEAAKRLVAALESLDQVVSS